MPTIVIDPGHGGKDSGATYKGEMEKTVTLNVAMKMRELVKEMSAFSFFFTRAFDFTLSLESRCRFANMVKADLFISIHCNADPDDDTNFDHIARGEEIWIHPGSANSRRFAVILQKYAMKYAQVHRGIKESQGLYVLRHTKMPAAIVEIGFIDDPEFSKDPPVEMAAVAIVDAVKEYYDAAVV